MGALDAIREAKRLNSAPDGKKSVILANDDAKEVLEITDGNIDMVSPYTPLIGDIGIRAVIKHIGDKEGFNEAPPKLIITPNLPMITKTKPLVTYPDVVPDEPVTAAIALAEALGCELHATTFSVEIPALSSPLAGMLINVAELIQTTEENTRAHCRRLQEAALTAGADMLVMGAFGHSRIRDFILGGAMQGVFAELRLPVLLSH